MVVSACDGWAQLTRQQGVNSGQRRAKKIAHEEERPCHRGIARRAHAALHLMHLEVPQVFGCHGQPARRAISLALRLILAKPSQFGANQTASQCVRRVQP